MILSIHPQNPQARLIHKLTMVLKKGGIIVYPTDTYYGIGCDIMCKKAIEKIRLLKKDKTNKRFSIICSDLKHISEYAYVSNYAYRTMKRVLPGPFTFILPSTKLVPRILLTNQKTIGIRVPNNTICLDLVKELGNPLFTTTAPMPNGTPPKTPREYDEHFGKSVDFIIDGGPAPSEPSTIISYTEDQAEVLREGLGDASFLL